MQSLSVFAHGSSSELSECRSDLASWKSLLETHQTEIMKMHPHIQRVKCNSLEI